MTKKGKVKTMVRLVVIKGPNTNDTDSVVEIYADTKSEVTPDMVVEGLNRAIAPGSMCYTADGQIAIYTSTGEWSWI